MTLRLKEKEPDQSMTIPPTSVGIFLYILTLIGYPSSLDVQLQSLYSTYPLLSYQLHCGVRLTSHYYNITLGKLTLLSHHLMKLTNWNQRSQSDTSV
jgi:hypothetical protein